MKRYVRSFLNRESFVQLVKVGIVGVANTVVSFALFNLFLFGLGWSPTWAVTGAFALTTFMSYLLNRRWTFRLKDGRVSGGETVRFYLVNVGAWGGTVGIVWLAESLWGPLGKLGANLAYLVASGLILLPKLASYRDVVFGKALRGAGGRVRSPGG